MIIHNPILTGSFTVNGTDVASITSSAASITAINSYTASQNILNGTYATTGSNTFAGIQTVNSNLVVTGSITAQTLVVQTVSSSVIYSSGSNVFGNNIANTQVFTGSMSLTGSLTVVTTGTEFQVTNTGVRIGNISTDTHPITGSVNVSGSAAFSGSVTINGASATTSLNVVGSGPNGMLLDQDIASVNASSRLFFKMSTQTYAILADSNGLTFSSGATAGSSTGSPKMTISSAGNVGIGTTSPDTLFQAAATGAAGISIRTNTSGDSFYRIYLDSTNYAHWYADRANSKVTIGSVASVPLTFDTGGTERLRITSAGLITKTVDNTTTGQIQFGGQTGSPPNAILVGAADQNGPYPIGVKALSNPSSQGLVGFFDYTNNSQGNISISSTTISYNSFMGSHWSQLSDNSKPEILKGTVLEVIDELCEWENEVNDRLAKIKISNTVESKNVYGVFFDWDNMDNLNDMYVAALGAGYIRVNSSQDISIGDLLQSNGDGTAKVQSDDIMRSSTIAKVVSTNKIETYEDGSYLVAATLHCG
jgi:hypothetical protein